MLNYADSLPAHIDSFVLVSEYGGLYSHQRSESAFLESKEVVAVALGAFRVNCNRIVPGVVFNQLLSLLNLIEHSLFLLLGPGSSNVERLKPRYCLVEDWDLQDLGFRQEASVEHYN